VGFTGWAASSAALPDDPKGCARISKTRQVHTKRTIRRVFMRNIVPEIGTGIIMLYTITIHQERENFI
jgi:hypothetical protein